MQKTWAPSLEDPLEKERAAHCSILAWEIPWTEDPGRLPFMSSQESQTQLNWSPTTKAMIVDLLILKYCAWKIHLFTIQAITKSKSKNKSRAGKIFINHLILVLHLKIRRASLVVQLLKNYPAMQVWSLESCFLVKISSEGMMQEVMHCDSIFQIKDCINEE